MTTEKTHLNTVLAMGVAATELDGWWPDGPVFPAPGPAPQPVLPRTRRSRRISLPRGDTILRSLPSKPARGDQEQVAAEALLASLRVVRERFLAAYAEPIYAALTDGYRRFLRVDELVYRRRRALPRIWCRPERRSRASGSFLQKDKEGLEIDQGLFFSQILTHRTAGLHLLQAMLRPTARGRGVAAAIPRRRRARPRPVRLERRRPGGPRHLPATRAYLNAEDDSTVLPLEIAVDLALLDPAIEVGVLRGGAVEHPKYAGRRVFSAGINLTHLYQGQISFVDFYLTRDLGLVNKLYRGLAGPEFLPDEPEIDPGETLDRGGRGIRDRRRLPAPADDGPRAGRSGRLLQPARPQGGDHPRRRQPAAAPLRRRPAGPAGRSSSSAPSPPTRRRAPCSATRSSRRARWTRRSRGRWRR